MSRVLVTPATTGTKAKVVIDGCPRCRRQLRLDNAGEVGPDGDYAEITRSVAIAQRLHLDQCRG